MSSVESPPEATRRHVRFAVLTVSDTRTLETDRSGGLLVERLLAAGHALADRDLLRDDAGAIREKVQEWLASPDVDVILVTGGTGFTGRDVTVDVVKPLFDKEMVGFGELFRWLSFAEIGTSTIQSRATGGLANGTLVFLLPGSTGACRLAWDQILVHQLDASHRPCNLVDLMPRFGER